jgi:phosphoglycerate dehydrogenase-like enzyme
MNARFNVLVTAPYFQPVVDRFREKLKRHGIELTTPHVVERLEEDELLPLVKDIDGAICGDDRFTRKVLEAAPKLKVISKWGTGIDSIDLFACEALGIAVRNTPGAFTAPVADSVLGYILCFARSLPAMDRAMKAGEWRKIPGRSLSECTVGIVGVGNVGKAVATRAKAFGAELLGNDIRELSPEEAPGVQMTGLQDLLGRSHFVCVCCDLNPTSHRLLGETEFTLMRDDAVLVNLARGSIVDEVALVDALGAGRIRGAALDVFEHEPLPSSSRLRLFDNVMLAPHNANNGPGAWERVHHNTVANLLEVLEQSEE